MKAIALRTVITIVIASLAISIVFSQDKDKGPLQLSGRAIEGMMGSTGEKSLQKFIEVHLAREYCDKFAPGELIKYLEKIRAACSGFGGVLVERVGDDSARITFLQEERQTSVVFRFQTAPPHQIVSLELEASKRPEKASPDVPPLSWESLSTRLDEEAKAGFTGVVLVVHSGKIILHEGYGLANREKGIPNTAETIFAIGSVPIDFTKAAILRLEEMGKLHTSDSITKFLGDVPEDKRSMTLNHLMSGRSGLPNFHDIRGVDADPDLSWIDRTEAIRRILSQDLLFSPGNGQAHSHSGWGLLAAIVEIVSKETYGDFLRRHFFEPAGMTRTGLHEDGSRFPDGDFAVGHGGQTYGKINIPKYWGKTSWLVMGSGGMQSTPLDLYKWLEAIRSGKTLSPEAAAKYWTDGVLAGGDRRGFFCLYTEGPDNLMIMCTNSHSGRGDRASALGERLVELVREESSPRFSLGIEMGVDAEGRITIRRVMPGGAAERDGLKEGDVVLAVNGDKLIDPPLKILQRLLRTGEPIAFEVDRGGTSKKIIVKPNPKAGRSH
jgi:CubicO group peptidase (beta-lactamase class C family)